MHAIIRNRVVLRHHHTYPKAAREGWREGYLGATCSKLVPSSLCVFQVNLSYVSPCFIFFCQLRGAFPVADQAPGWPAPAVRARSVAAGAALRSTLRGHTQEDQGDFKAIDSAGTDNQGDAMLPTPGASRRRRPFTQLAHSPAASPECDQAKQLLPPSSLSDAASQLPSLSPRASGSPCTPPCSSHPAAAPSPTTSTAAAAAVAGVVGSAPAALLARGAHSFAQAVLESPLVVSALLQLEQSGAHPIHESTGVRSLHLTLAQMLALHLRAQYDAASEVQLLTLLWTLEAWGSSVRARCTDALYSYLQNLDCFDSQRAQRMGRNWTQEFLGLKCAMVQCQEELLARLKWALRLDFQTEVAPCMHLLFSALPRATPPSPGPQPWPIIAAAAAGALHCSHLPQQRPVGQGMAAARPTGMAERQPGVSECRLLQLCRAIQQRATAVAAGSMASHAAERHSVGPDQGASAPAKCCRCA